MNKLSLLPLMLATGAAAQPVEEIVVVGVRDTSTIYTDDRLVAPADTAQLLREMPGANVNRNGELTGLVQYRGMYGGRVATSVDGAAISSAGPNSMDAPLHYAPVALLQSLTVHRGIAPVSSGQETIGGSVEAELLKGEFGLSSRFGWDARLYAGGQSVNGGSVASGDVTLANDHHLLHASLLREEANDSRFPGGDIVPSSYERERFGLGYGFRSGAHEWGVDFSRYNTGNAGTAALPMDILAVDTNLVHGRYRWQGVATTVMASLSLHDLGHDMTNYHLRRAPASPSLYRRTVAGSDSRSFRLKVERDVQNGLWRFGADGHYAEHDAEIFNPKLPGFFIGNFRAAERGVTGLFLERELRLTDPLSLQAGLRVNRVETDSAPVAADLDPMKLGGMPGMMNGLAAAIAADFNGAGRARGDTNLDWFARLSLETRGDFTWYAGLARKSRSPSYQERYLWLPLESTGGLADGNTYVGDPALQPETAHELELGFDWNGAGLSLYPRVFYREVEDYIQGLPAADPQVTRFAQMMADMGMGRADPLRFSNVDARLYGLDVEASWDLGSSLELRGVLSMVRGERHGGDDLYRIALDNLLLALDYRGEGWTATLESHSFARQDRVSLVNRESATGGYSLLNAALKFRLSDGVEAGLGVNNLLDREYRDHLAGYNRAWNPDLGPRERLPGLGRSVYGRIIMEF